MDYQSVGLWTDTKKKRIKFETNSTISDQATWADLEKIDLYCMYMTKSGFLNNNFRPPFIRRVDLYAGILSTTTAWNIQIVNILATADNMPWKTNGIANGLLINFPSNFWKHIV